MLQFFEYRESDFFRLQGISDDGNGVCRARFTNVETKANTEQFAEFFYNPDVQMTTPDGVTMDWRCLEVRRSNLIALKIQPDLTDQAMQEMGIEPRPIAGYALEVPAPPHLD